MLVKPIKKDHAKHGLFCVILNAARCAAFKNLSALLNVARGNSVGNLAVLLGIAIAGKTMVSELKYLAVNSISKKIKFLPYALVGIAVFTFNANSDINPYLQVYVTLLEAKLGVVLVYFLTKKLGSLRKDKSINPN